MPQSSNVLTTVKIRIEVYDFSFRFVYPLQLGFLSFLIRYVVKESRYVCHPTVVLVQIDSTNIVHDFVDVLRRQVEEKQTRKKSVTAEVSFR